MYFVWCNYILTTVTFEYIFQERNIFPNAYLWTFDLDILIDLCPSSGPPRVPMRTQLHTTFFFVFWLKYPCLCWKTNDLNNFPLRRYQLFYYRHLWNIQVTNFLIRPPKHFMNSFPIFACVIICSTVVCCNSLAALILLLRILLSLNLTF